MKLTSRVKNVVSEHLEASKSGYCITHTTWHVEHALELQIMKVALEGNGICDALRTIVTAGDLSDAQKAGFMKDLIREINDKTNLFNVNKRLNAAVSVTCSSISTSSHNIAWDD